jgi:hypothetical protein
MPPACWQHASFPATRHQRRPGLHPRASYPRVQGQIRFPFRYAEQPERTLRHAAGRPSSQQESRILFGVPGRDC